MTLKKQIIAVLLGLLGLSSVVPVFAFAQTASSSSTISSARTEKAKQQADTEINRRVTALTDLLARVRAMSKVTADFKTALTTNVQNQITVLNSLKSKIDADTDGATLKTDIQSITAAYRIFMLIIPQGRIAAAADREATIINALTEVGLKVQTRLQDAQKAGADVGALGAVLTDFGKQLADAQTHAQAAISGSAVLTPDNGDKTKMDANKTALKQARIDIGTAQKDLVAAHKDIKTIIDGLKKLKTGTTASTTKQSQ